MRTWEGQPDWAADPELGAARLVVANLNNPLTSLLRLNSRFELVYEDKVAVIFVARSQPEGQEAQSCASKCPNDKQT